MTIFLAVLAPTLGFLGLFIGAFLSEWLRRKNRREQFAQIIFEKRLAAYEGLLLRIGVGSDIVDQLIRNGASAEKRHQEVATAISDVIEFTEANRLYLNEEIALHCGALFMGTEDIPDAPKDEQPGLLQDYHEMRKDAVRMITEDSGVAELNRLFQDVNKPDISSEFIERLRFLKAEFDSKKVKKNL